MGANKRSSHWISSFNILIILAVLSVLVAALMPPDCGCHRRFKNKAPHTIREIANIELAITKLLSDAGKDNLRELFAEDAFNTAVADLVREKGMDAFSASVEIYTHTTYTLLRNGRDIPESSIDYLDVLNRDLVRKLGTGYMSDLAFDPWGNLYQIYPGPWPDDMGPVLFRTYLPSIQELERGRIKPTDNLLMEGMHIQTGEPIIFGWSARSQMDVYIWSKGMNQVSGQPYYDPTHQYAPPPFQHYNQAQEPEFCGGGDDINNWDREQTYMNFYN